MSDLYEEDILLWSERQGDLLRRLARGERVNDQIDWDNVAEEIESVGRSERHAVGSHLIQAMVHALKALAWPQLKAVSHWQAEMRAARSDARRRFSPSMRQLIDMADLYSTALDRLPQEIDAQPPQPLPETCPFTLDELLAPVQRPT
jgi:hypothetical protein